MARFGVYPHPDPAHRKKIPYLLDVQISHIDKIGTRGVIPMRHIEHFTLRMRDLNPTFDIGGKTVGLDTTGLAAIPSTDPKRPPLNLGNRSTDILAALDALFCPY